MDVREAIKLRRSIRKFQNKNIPRETLEKILNAGRLAPSANNRQPWKFITVIDETKRRKLAEAAKGQKFVGEASAIIVGVALNPDYIMSCGVPGYAVDISIALDHMMLAAVEEGLGTCWIGAFHQQKVKNLLYIPDKYKVVALLPIGFADETPNPKSRKPLDRILNYERYYED
jgi:nitroreductase